ncbi:L-lactate dehydrogenase [Endomicrobium proavitum]|uniref:L-lactate dehydrogenase n=1 Tax=Endomicrobium proavitum TaxID=1408281 RepID=A0A0G3WKH7_9BACT|nr:L-lactate dehydrogenase [Endomicrobium proavitum]AKL98410.1 L-lactate dehydrogenase [Endomicrobium proavitum]
MADKLSPKVSIIGCGNVGMRYAYSMIIKGAARELVLVDYNRQKAEGEAMDLSHGAPFVSPINIYAGDYPDTANSDLVVITAGRGQKPGETRIDLIKGNAEILKSVVPQVVKYSPKAIILVASNPVDILSYITYKISGKPANEVIGSGTVLDSARFRFLIGKHCNVDSRSIHASIFGEHGDTEFPMWSKAMIGGVLFKDYCKVCNKENCAKQEDAKLNEIFEDVRDSAYEIIAKKGETSYGIGLALTKISKAILKDENSVLPVSSLLDNYHGVSGIYLSVPAVVNKGGIRQTLQVDFDMVELDSFINSAEQVKKVIKASGF